MSIVFPVMMRCRVPTCRYTWSVTPDEIETARCACGGELERFDVEAHGMTLPYVPFDPSKK